MNNLDDLGAIKGIDKTGMLELVNNFPKQVKEALEIGLKFDPPQDYRQIQIERIVFCGLGGSAIGGDVIRSITANEIKVPIFVNRTYDIPAFIDEKTLVIISSYSGNTEETLSSFAQVLKKKAKVLAVTSGGKVAEIAKEKNLPVITIPGGLPPRAALGYSSIPTLLAFAKLGLIAPVEDDIRKMIKLLTKLRDEELGAEIQAADNPAKTLAVKLHGNLAAIYAADQVDVTALRFRGQIAENAKQLASHHVLPEMNHNEIVGWGIPENITRQCVAIFLSDDADLPKIQDRMDITKDLIADEEVKIISVQAQGDSPLAKALYLIYVGDFVSYYMAVLNGVDPTPIERIDLFKERLGA